MGNAVGWIGGVSNIIFVVHPIIRELYLGEYGIKPASPFIGLLSYIAITLVIASVIKYRIQVLHIVQKIVQNPDL